MTKVIVSGCMGNMGEILCKKLEEEEDMWITAGVDIVSTPNIEHCYSVYTSFRKINNYDLAHEVDVIIDFSSPAATEELLNCVEEFKIPLVLATTGISDQNIERMKEISKSVPIFYSSNMSYDICILQRILRCAAPMLSYTDIEITEEHHNRKADFPSGTAKMLANTINDSLGNNLNIVYGRTEKRKTNEIGISSIRGGNICGTHTVHFFGKDSTFEIKHISHSRDSFANGAIMAAKFLREKKRNNMTGLYTMDDLL